MTEKGGGKATVMSNAIGIMSNQTAFFIVHLRFLWRNIGVTDDEGKGGREKGTFYFSSSCRCHPQRRKEHSRQACICELRR